MTHSSDVDDRVAKMLAMGTPGAIAAQKPPPAPDPAQEPPQEAPEAPAKATGPKEAETSPVPPQRAPRKPRQPKTPRSTKSPAAAPSDNKIRFTVAMDQDLIELMSLARPAWGGKTIAQIFFAAARRHASIAAELPDTPLVETVLDDKYEDVVMQAAHRTAYSGYVKPRAYEALAADAYAVGLESSEFIRRTVRRYLAVEHAFVPKSKAHLLVQPSTSCGALMEELKIHLDTQRPAPVLPTPGSLVWDAVALPDGTPLRYLTDEALARMPGCTSATQALLAVL